MNGAHWTTRTGYSITIVSPAEFHLTLPIVSILEISLLYSLQANKKALRNDRKALMVELVDESWHQIVEELGRWRGLIPMPSQRRSTIHTY